MISNARDRVLLDTKHSGVFLTSCKVFGNVVKHGLEYIFNISSQSKLIKTK